MGKGRGGGETIERRSKDVEEKFSFSMSVNTSSFIDGATGLSPEGPGSN
jgi:hypothetical protein